MALCHLPRWWWDTHVATHTLSFLLLAPDACWSEPNAKTKTKINGSAVIVAIDPIGP
jgi:hypothetical protein